MERNKERIEDIKTNPQYFFMRLNQKLHLETPYLSSEVLDEVIKGKSDEKRSLKQQRSQQFKRNMKS